MKATSVRLELDARGPGRPVNIALWQAAQARIEFAFFKTPQPDADLEDDFDNLADLKLEIYPSANSDDVLAQAEFDLDELNEALTAEEWDDGVSQHGYFDLTTAQLNQTFAGAVGTFWVVIFSATLSPGEKIVHAAGQLLLARNQASGAELPPPVPEEEYYTSAQVDARISFVEGLDGALYIKVTTGAGTVYAPATEDDPTS